MNKLQRTSPAFIAASWVALLLGALAYLVGLWNAEMLLNEKGYYLTLLLYGLYAAVSLASIWKCLPQGNRGAVSRSFRLFMIET